MDLVVGGPVQAALRGGGSGGRAEKGPRQIRSVPEGPDGVGVEGEQIARPQRAIASFLEPRIRSLAGAEQPSVDPLGAALEHPGVVERPQLVFRHAGLQSRSNVRQRVFADGHRVAHAGNLLGRLDEGGLTHDRLGVVQLETLPGKRDATVVVEMAVHREARIALAIAPHHRKDLVRPPLEPPRGAHAGRRVVPRNGGPHLADGLERLDEVLRAAELEQRRFALGRNHRVAHGHVQGPHLHVADADRVEDVHGVVEQAGAAVAGAQLGLYPVHSVGSQPHPIDPGWDRADRPRRLTARFARHGGDWVVNARNCARSREASAARVANTLDSW